jgi:hypothetical protein
MLIYNGGGGRKGYMRCLFLKAKKESGMVAHAYSPSYWEVEIRNFAI